MIKNYLFYFNCVYCIFFIIDKNSKIDEEKKNYLNNVRNYFD